MARNGTRLLVAAAVVLMAQLGWVVEGKEAPWRSRLYPQNWTPAFTDGEGRFLHDFSYAGYRNGAAPLPAPKADAKVFDAVGAFGADRTGKADATGALQAAIDAAEAAGGGVVWVPAGLYRCDGVLVVDHSGVVVRGEGPEATRLFFTRSAKMTGRAHINFKGSIRRGAHIPLAADGANRAFTVRVHDASGLKLGTHVCLGWVITDAFVADHHMAGTWKVFNGKWRPIFRRTVVAVDTAKTPHEVTLDIPLRYPARVRDRASLRVETGYLENCALEDLAVSNAVAWGAAWGNNRVHAIEVRCGRNCWVRNVESFASPLPQARGRHLQSGGIMVSDSKAVTVEGCRMAAAQHRGGGGNGYLFEVTRSSDVLFRRCHAKGGRHSFIQNWDFGTSGCVWLQCTSEGSRAFVARYDPVGVPAYCEYHHSLAMACLVDQCTLVDGWYGGNRRHWSSGAGLSVTQSVYWNTRGGGRIRSWASGWGYIIGTHGITVRTALSDRSAAGTAPADYVEGRDRAATLVPQSLYLDQLRRRLGR